MAVFLQGCNLQCKSCHNPETIGICQACGTCLQHCPAQALEWVEGHIQWHADRCLACGTCERQCPHQGSPRVSRLSADALVGETERWGPLLEGLTFSGGECTLQAAFMLSVAERLPRRHGWTILVDTNGCMPVSILEALAAGTQGFLFDFKALDPERHQRLTGADNALILANLTRAAQLRKLVEVRTVLVPGYVDDAAEITAMATWLRAHAPDTPWRISPFRPEGVRQHFPPSDPERVADLVQRAREIYGEAWIRVPRATS